jgi:hypothetical protein
MFVLLAIKKDSTITEYVSEIFLYVKIPKSSVLVSLSMSTISSIK